MVVVVVFAAAADDDGNLLRAMVVVALVPIIIIIIIRTLKIYLDTARFMKPQAKSTASSHLIVVLLGQQNNCDFNGRPFVSIDFLQ